MKKIIISAVGKTMDSQVDSRFGRCQYFLVVDTETGEAKAIVNEAMDSPRGAGISAAQIVANQKVNAVITGNVGPRAFDVLNQAGAKIYSGVFNKTCKQALEDFQNGKLQATDTPSQSGAKNC